MKRLITLFLALALTLTLNSPVYAQCIDTAIGPICGLGDPGSFISALFPILIGIAGGIAFLLMIFGAFQILTSGGNAEQVKAGQELITSAVMGLLVIIFSVFLLQLIGKDILKIF